MKPLTRPLSLTIAIAFIALSTSAKALELNSQVHFRTGMITAGYSSAAQNLSESHSIPTSLDGEFELFLSPRSSFTLRGMFGFDMTTSRMLYSYTGVGKRYYLFSTGIPVDETAERARISIVPKWRYYIGGDAGISQVVVKTVNSVLQIDSSLLDVGAHAGAIWQLNRSLGIEAHLGYSRGFGFSSISVGAWTFRGFLGASYVL